MKFLFRIQSLIYLQLLFPLIAFAQGSQGGGAGSQGGGAGSQGGGAASQGVNTQTGGVQLKNPLGNQTLLGFFQDILDVIMVFAVPIIVLFIIYAGFKYVVAQGKPEEITAANRALLFAVVGGVLILGAQLLLYVISGTIDALG